MSEHDFSSWPREQEASFVVYERQTNDAARSALIAGAIAGGVFFLLIFGIYVGKDPEIKEVKGIDMSNLTKRTDDVKKADTPKPDPAKAEAPKTDTPKTDDKAPAEKPAADGTK